MAESPIPTDAVTISVDGELFHARPKRFKSGSVGWYLSGKTEVDGTPVQMSLSIVVIGSKPASPRYPITDPSPNPELDQLVKKARKRLRKHESDQMTLDEVKPAEGPLNES